MLTIATVNVSGLSSSPARTGGSRGRAVTLPSTPNSSDAALIRAIAYGDRHAMERLYARHSALEVMAPSLAPHSMPCPSRIASDPVQHRRR
jgi:hypothetical protein